MKFISNLIKSFNEKQQEKEKQRLTFELCALLDQKEPDLKAITALLTRGADPNMYVKDNGLFAMTPLQRAATGKSASLDAIKLLLEKGANPFLPVLTSTGRAGVTFSTVIDKDRPDVLQYLLDAEAQYEKTHGPQERFQKRCGIPRRK